MENSPKLQPQVLVEWEIMNKVIHERSKWWYILMSVLGATLLGIAIFTANLIFAIMIILVVFIVIVNDARPAKKIRFAITSDGLILGKNFIPLRDLTSFFIVFDPPYVMGLYFERKNLGTDISISLEGQDPNIVRNILLELLPENPDRETEPRSDALQKLFKF